MPDLAAHLALGALDPTVKTEQDVLDDYAREVAVLHRLAPDDAHRRLERFLAIYHEGTEVGTRGEWAAIVRGDDVEYSLIRLTKPFRFRASSTIPATLKAIPKYLGTGSTHPRVLDFGGGGGTDAIVYARSGFDAEYADLTALRHTDVVRRRFDLRHLTIPVHDGLDLPAVRSDVVTAMDVLEHIYDVESTTASLLGRLPKGGLLCCANAFSQITYDGDHLDKNRIYVDLFPRLLGAAGFERVDDHPPLEVYRRLSDGDEDVRTDVAEIRRTMYLTTRARAVERCSELLPRLDGVQELDWASLPGSPPLSLHCGANGGPVTTGYRFAARHAPAPVRALARRVRRHRAEQAVASGGDSASDAASFADWIAVLRIAESRLGQSEASHAAPDR